MTTLLLIEDDDAIADVLQTQLTRADFVVHRAARGDDGLQMALQDLPDVVVLDLMLPGKSGLDICRAVRADPRTATLPLLIASAKGEEDDIVRGLELGADDYLVKPFRPRELIARIRSVLRRRQFTAPPAATALIQCGPFCIDSTQFQITIDRQPITTTRAEFRLLAALAGQPGRVFTRDQLLDAITGGGVAIIDRNVDVHIRSLRKKSGAAAAWIETIRGIGYRLRPREEE